jgi:hypothetical protein
MALPVGSIPHLRLRPNYARRAKSLQLKRRHRKTQQLLVWIRGIGTALQSGFERKGIWNYCSKPHSETKVTMQQHQLQPTIVASGFRRLPVGDRTKVASDCQGASQAAGDARPTGAVERMRVTRKAPSINARTEHGVAPVQN